MAFTKVTTTLADTLNQNTTGSAATLTTARTIGGTSFDGSADIAVALAATATSLASARTIGGTSFDGTGNISVGLAATATALATARTIGGTSFDGTANIVPGTATLATTTTVTDSSANTNFPIVFHNESNGLLDDTGALRYNPSTGTLLAPNLVVAGTTTQVDTVTMNAQNAVIFEGATADNYETTLSIVDPTADHTQYLINQTGYIPLLAVATTTAISSTPAELNLLDGSSANSVVNSKAVIYGSSGQVAATTLAVSGETTLADHLNIGDSDRIKIGDGPDLELWHDTNNSIIKNSTGNLYLRSDNNIIFQDKGGNETLANFADNGAVTLYYDNSPKLATVTGGIDVTGSVTADGVILDDNTTYQGIKFQGASSNRWLALHNVSGDLRFGTGTTYGSGSEYLRIDSAGNVGIGVTPKTWYSNATALQISPTGALYNTSNWEDFSIANNAYYNSSGTESYIQDDAACKIRLTDSGLMDFRVASSGDADDPINWTTALAIDNSGAVDVSGRVSHSTITTLSSDGTPSVSAGNYFVTGDTTTITDFDDGVVGQTIRILAEHAKTITDNAAIILDGSVNFVMADGDTLTLTMFNDQVWQETGRATNVATTSGTSVGILMFYGAQQ